MHCYNPVDVHGIIMDVYVVRVVVSYDAIRRRQSGINRNLYGHNAFSGQTFLPNKARIEMPERRVRA